MHHPEIAKLDRQLAKKGERVTLRREAFGAEPVDVDCLAFCRGAKPDELVGGIDQFESVVIVSPTGLQATAWPAPPQRGDLITRQGRTRSIVSAMPVVIGETVIRYDLKVLG